MQDRKYGPQSLVSILTLALTLVAGVNLANAQSPEDTSQVKAATRNFFEAYQRKDVDALLGMWSAKSPDLAAFTTSVKQAFSEIGSIELKDLALRRIAFEGDYAIVEVTGEMQATDMKSGKPAAGLGLINRILRFVKEDGQLKLWQYEVPEEKLAVDLLAAKTESEQTALLEKDSQLLTTALSNSLWKRSLGMVQRNEFAPALNALALTQRVAEKVRDEAAFANSVTSRQSFIFNAVNFRGRLSCGRSTWRWI